MRTIELLNLYSDFSEDEIRDFEKYLRSPYFVTVKSSVHIFKEIIRNRNLIVLKSYDKISGKLCRKFKLTSGALSKHFSFLSKTTLDFLTVRSIKKNQMSSRLMLDQYLLDQGHLSILKKHLSSRKDFTNNFNPIENDYFINSYCYNILNHDFLLKTGELLDYKTADKKNFYLDEAAGDIMLHTLMQLTIIYINYFSLDVNLGNRKRYLFRINLKQSYDDTEKINLFSSNRTKQSVFRFYKNLFCMYYHKDETSYYHECKGQFKRMQNIFSRELVKCHYQMLINFCMLKDRLGEERDFFRKESVELLYQYFNEDFFIAGKEYLHHVEYANFIIRAFSVGDYEKIKSFIDKNSTTLNPSEYDKMVNYGLAFYYLGVKNYRSALKHINNIRIKDFIYKYDVLNIELRLYYELNKNEPFRDTIHNYRKTVLEDNKLTASDKAGLLTMLNYLKQLISISEEPDTAKRIIKSEYIILSLKKEPMFSLKKWLTEKFLVLSNQYAGESR